MSNRFHLHVGVQDIKQSICFYTALFGQPPSKVKEDYAKWMIDDPKINFAISTRPKEVGVDHLGIQVDDSNQVATISNRLRDAQLALYDEGETTCCYAKSNKAWVTDPAGIAWEVYHHMDDADVYGSERTNEEAIPTKETVARLNGDVTNVPTSIRSCCTKSQCAK